VINHTSGPVLRNVISFRLDDAATQWLQAFRDSFNPPQLTIAMRWLLEDPRVREVMREHIQHATFEGE
jgi:hypothetical protein